MAIAILPGVGPASSSARNRAGLRLPVRGASAAVNAVDDAAIFVAGPPARDPAWRSARTQAINLDRNGLKLVYIASASIAEIGTAACCRFYYGF